MTDGGNSNTRWDRGEGDGGRRAGGGRRSGGAEVSGDLDGQAAEEDGMDVQAGQGGGRVTLLIFCLRLGCYLFKTGDILFYFKYRADYL